MTEEHNSDRRILDLLKSCMRFPFISAAHEYMTISRCVARADVYTHQLVELKNKIELKAICPGSNLGRGELKR